MHYHASHTSLHCGKMPVHETVSMLLMQIECKFTPWEGTNLSRLVLQLLDSDYAGG